MVEVDRDELSDDEWAKQVPGIAATMHFKLNHCPRCGNPTEIPEDVKMLDFGPKGGCQLNVAAEALVVMANMTLEKVGLLFNGTPLWADGMAGDTPDKVADRWGQARDCFQTRNRLQGSLGAGVSSE